MILLSYFQPSGDQRRYGRKNWITDYRLNLEEYLFSAQILLAAFGALITVPVLTGLDPGVAIFTAGAFTLKGVALATVTGVILKRILPDKKAEKKQINSVSSAR